MPVCGAGCMGFVNVARGLRAIGYTEPDPLPAGPVALVTHSGSVFSALLRTRRAFGFTVAVSSGQELVTPAAAYARYALTLPETKVLALVLEAIRDGALLRAVLADAADRDVPVVLLAAGTSAASRSLVAAHSGALAAGDGAWQALAAAHGVHRVGDLAELADTLELFCAGRRWGGAGAHRRPRPQPRRGRPTPPDRRAARPGGVATVHDSGFERAHVADVAASVGVPFAQLTDQTRERLAAVLDPGLEPGNPLDVWGTGRDSEELFTETLSALADDANVGAVALAVDLVPEYDGDDSYRDAVLAAAARTDKPVVVLASVPAAIDTDAATRLRAAGVPVLESTRSGLLALGHLLAHAAPPRPATATAAPTRHRASAAALPRPSATRPLRSPAPRPPSRPTAVRARFRRRARVAPVALGGRAGGRPARRRRPLRPAPRLRRPRRPRALGRHAGGGDRGRRRDRLPGRDQDRRARDRPQVRRRRRSPQHRRPGRPRRRLRGPRRPPRPPRHRLRNGGAGDRAHPRPGPRPGPRPARRRRRRGRPGRVPGRARRRPPAAVGGRRRRDDLRAAGGRGPGRRPRPAAVRRRRASRRGRRLLARWRPTSGSTSTPSTSTR